MDCDSASITNATETSLEPNNSESNSSVPKSTVVESNSPIKTNHSPALKVKRRQCRSLVTLSTEKPHDFPSKRVRPDPSLIKNLPLIYEFCPVKDLVILISDMIEELIQTNDDLPIRTSVLTRFHSRTPPGISVLDYLQRLAKHATLTPPLLLSMVYYIDQLCLLYPDFMVNSLTVHRFLITACTVASKGLSDAFWSNTTYARVGGISFTELGLLELELLHRLDWKIIPKPDALTNYYKGLVTRTTKYQMESEGNSNKSEKTNEDEDPSHHQISSMRLPRINGEPGTDEHLTGKCNEPCKDVNNEPK